MVTEYPFNRLHSSGVLVGKGTVFFDCTKPDDSGQVDRTTATLIATGSNKSDHIIHCLSMIEQ